MNEDLSRKPYSVEVVNAEETEEGWRFIIRVAENDRTDEFIVRLDRDYWEKLTEGEKEPADIARSTITFLLEREPKETLDRTVTVKDIHKRFSEFETEMNEL